MARKSASFFIADVLPILFIGYLGDSANAIVSQVK